MKKFLVVVCMVIFLFMAGPVSAAWTVTVSPPKFVGNKAWFSVSLTGDGTALTATDLMAKIDSAFAKRLKGYSLRFLFVDPGAGGAQPSGTINITLTNEFASNTGQLWADTGITNTSDSWHQLWKDIGDYPPILGKLNLAVNDIGSAKTVALYFIAFVD